MTVGFRMLVWVKEMEIAAAEERRKTKMAFSFLQNQLLMYPDGNYLNLECELLPRERQSVIKQIFDSLDVLPTKIPQR